MSEDEPTQGHDEDGTDLARIIARSARGESTVPGRPRTSEPPVDLPAPRGVRPRPRRRRPPSTDWSGPGPDQRDPVALGAAFESLVARRGWGKQVNLRLVLARWPQLVGQANADHSRPVAYRDTVLTVQADSTVWATSLRAMAPQLVAELNSQLGQGTVTKVVVEGPHAPSWKHGPRSVPGRGPRDTYG